MGIVNVRLKGSPGAGKPLIDAHIHPFETVNGIHHGLVSLTRELLELNPGIKPFLNENFGNAMNQNIGFSGNPLLIFDGVGAGWTSSIIAGDWDFTDAGKVSITTANNNDQALWDGSDGAYGSTDMNDYTALTGLVDLDIFSPINNGMIVQFLFQGATVGNSVNLNDIIDTGIFTEQSFAIPKAVFGLTTQTIDQMTILIERTGGAKPTIKFDNFQWQETGTPATFKVTTPLGTRFHITELRLRLTADIDSTLSNNSMPNIDYNTILGVPKLTNGIVFSRLQKGKVSFAVSLKCLDDFFATGSNLIISTGNASKLGITLVVEFPKPIILEGDDGSNFFAFTIADDLSALTRFTGFARGAIEE